MPLQGTATQETDDVVRLRHEPALAVPIPPTPTVARHLVIVGEGQALTATAGQWKTTGSRLIGEEIETVAVRQRKKAGVNGHHHAALVQHLPIQYSVNGHHQDATIRTKVVDRLIDGTEEAVARRRARRL